MVVSVEISGVLEHKLRRLVDLGIYASVSEAVRDAVRRMLSSMDLRRIALNFYVTKGSSLAYACEFAETTCPKFIDYLLVNGVTPGLGWQGDVPDVDSSGTYLIDSISIFVIFNTLLYNIFHGVGNVIELYIPESLAHYYRLMSATASRVGAKKLPAFKLIKIKESKPPQNLLLTRHEYSIINHAKNTKMTVVSDDFYVQKVASQNNIKVIPSISFLLYARKQKIINDIEYRETLLSLRGLPYMYPSSMEEAEQR
ncbi:MAG: type II toxin-antitoxin system ParD family antitoxin [Desulfurococcales archaeon]|nr:type II toxin-antitoxin system ParD family antitoxin [Desulfurococcales archaeon]